VETPERKGLLCKIEMVTAHLQTAFSSLFSLRLFTSESPFIYPSFSLRICFDRWILAKSKPPSATGVSTLLVNP
jgi:hypothetical protein